MAMSQMQGYPVFGSRLRLSWGKPDKHMDPAYQEYYEQSARKAYMAYVDFRGRMQRNEPRGEDDSYWV